MVKQAVIVAAGLGARLKHRTATQPKGFLEVDGTSLIKRSLVKLKKAGIEHIIIGTGYHSEFYEQLSADDNSISCIKSDRFESTSSMYTLFNMREQLKGDFLLLESDLLYEQNALTQILLSPHTDIMLGSGATHSNDEVYLQVNSQHQLERVSKKRNTLSSVYAELVGINKISANRYALMNQCFETRLQSNPKMDYELAMALSSKIQPLHVLKIDDLAWCEIDDEQHLERALSHVLPNIESKDNEHQA
jgi:2-aminoethylphosphonate-pyruvate transaminase